MRKTLRTPTLFSLALLSLLAASASGQIAPEEHVLDNGMKFLLLPRRHEPGTVSVAWVAKVGSAVERPGITGMNLFLEHLLRIEPTMTAPENLLADLQYLQKKEELAAQLRELHQTVQKERVAAGEIDDPWDPAHDTEEMRRLRAELMEVSKEHAKIIVHNIYEQTYTDAGATDLNAFASHDATIYSMTLPSAGLEMWAHLESQRLDKPVFRTLHVEHAAAPQRRSLTIAAKPTGALDAQFDELFWKGTPYAWPVTGRVGDVESISRRQLVGFFELFYQPSNLVGIVVGDFDPAALKPILARTFGKLQSGRTPPPQFGLGVIEQESEERFSGQCDCPPRLELRYHTVPFNHPDSFALEVMAELLNAPEGRLRDLLIGPSPRAAGVRAGQMSRRLGGCFYFIAEPAESVTATELERTWTAELDRLRTEPATDEELERVRQRISAGANLENQSNRELAFQFGVYEAMGGWEYTLRRAERLRAVTAEDVMRVAKTYFEPANRAIAVYTTSAGGGAAEDPLSSYPPEQRAQYEETLRRLMSYEDPDDVRRAVAAFEEALKSTPEPHRPAVAYLLQRLRQRLEELEGDRNP